MISNGKTGLSKKEIDQLGAVLGLILSKLFNARSKVSIENNQEVVQQSLMEQLQMDLKTILQLPDDELIEYLKAKRNFSNNNLAAFAEILWQLIESKSSIQNLIPCCLNLLLYLEHNEKDYDLQRHWRISQLIQF